MIETINAVIEEVKAIQKDRSMEPEAFRMKYLAKKGLITNFFQEFKSVPNEQKREYGQVINTLKNLAEDVYGALKADAGSSAAGTRIEDPTKRTESLGFGQKHPISSVRDEIIEIFSRVGFDVSEGPEIEDDWHNFSALNFPEEHPARDMQDTFFVAKDPDWALRTHTSSVQVRAMEKQQPPIRTISPGRVFRNEAISTRSHCMFHQIEGLYIDKDVSFADLKQMIQYFADSFFGKDTKIRLRPSYFPFTEPSAEVDIYWGLENEIDYRITKGTGWLEIMGCGMVDPNVLSACGIDPEVYSGYAFGMGIERIAMNRYQIPDLRMYFENDIRFLQLFESGL
ncbi:MAG: phenylalanine--tRNA ligase subunit alpha [Schleiferiaceae bacterium]|nr:phenylalanine--tRNA ligase subunit alpha [Schleiferiaceae bacterium]